MNGTQKMIVALVGIFVAAGVLIGAIVVLGGSDDSQPAAIASNPPVPSPVASAIPEPVESTAPEESSSASDGVTEKVDRPSGVSANVVSGRNVKVEWDASPHDVRYFQVYDNGEMVGGKISPSLRHVVLTTSYGTHCFRVVAVAVSGARSSTVSACGSVTVEEPYNPPPGSYNPPPASDNNPPPSE